ncbi:UbiA family prenyltransferase [Diaminobutyricibacter sp. McL0608]|uniref:UbiA family prenyltransferase n=1 Tax=Leifsonia sp. McL0608 TaxID=3143537 RepID=UPI0031F332BE
MPKTVRSLLLASHPGPTVVVTLVAGVLGFGLAYAPARLLLLMAAILAGQLSIGWSNDWIDAGRDAAVHRPDKPAAQGAVAVSVVRTSAFAAAAAMVVLSLLLGPLAALTHIVAVAMGWAYNLGLKNTPISVLPYAVSFGLLPAVATLGQPVPQFPAPWVIVVGALLGVAAHFTNVLPDLADDRDTGVRGLPHRLGARASGYIAFACVAVATVILTFGPGPHPGPALLVGLVAGLVIVAVGVVLVARTNTTRILMRLIMACALIDVVMLALAGQSTAL